MAKVAAISVLRGKMSKEQIDRALINVGSNPEFKIPGTRYEVVHGDKYQETLEFLQKYFITDEHLSNSSGVSTVEEVFDLWGSTLTQGMSLVLVSEESDEIMATRIMGLLNKDDKADLDKCCTEAIRNVAEFCQCAWKTNNVLEKFNVEDVVHFFGLCTHPDLRQKKVATTIFKAALSLVKDLGIENVVILGEGSFNFSQLVYEGRGFETLNELIFAEYKKDEDIVFKNTAPHTSMKVFAKVFL